MKKFIKLSAVAVSMLFFAGCSAPEIKLEQDGGAISVVKTNYSEALKNANGMVSIFNNGQPVEIYVTPIVDRTNSGGKLPKNITSIVNSSFNSIGDKIITIANIKGKKFSKNKFYRINGAITEFDLIEASGSGMDAAGQATYNNQQGTIDAGMKRENKTTKLTIVFNPEDVRTRNFVPRASTKNKITIEQKSSGNEFAFSILGTGVGVDNALTKAQGTHSSITILIELSVVEVLGRLVNYPYWLLTGGGVNSDVVSNLSIRFLRDPLNKKIQKVSYLLALQGANVQMTSMMNPKLKAAIIKYKTTHGLPANSDINRKLYMSLIGAS
ncbi:hypothetical protein GSY74_08355 [Sulfurovum sp. bin170]|uniref:hypothetical protein n=1 Tax=Sulfurovum sp. bin170 TaxID=2695268 RepID=UPI0013DF88BA|nr:hypothetical protein [Sulfurovum sp. bin170]NEW61293.1 hypothetical protein [Sulfurovum sp. bin170]